MYDFLRITAAVPDIKVGDVKFNTNQIITKIGDAVSAGSDIIVFPELALTGYTCGDLFFQSVLYREVAGALHSVSEQSCASLSVIVLGAPLKMENQYYSCAVVIADGRIRGIVPKTFLPAYNEFYERRWFSSSEDLTVTKINAREIGMTEDYTVPVGRNLIFNINGEYKFAVEICEDLWAPLPPSSFSALGGAELILNLSASNETISKRAYRRELVKQQSARNICAYAYVSSGGCESTTDVVFSGHGIISENGSVAAENKNLIDSDYLLSADVDLGKIRADRGKNKSFKDCIRIYAGKEPCVYVDVTSPSLNLKSDGSLCKIDKMPFVPSDKKDRLERCKDIFEMQVAGLKKRAETTGGKMVIGVSGGLDSTLALLVCAETAKRLGRTLTDVVGITMPCFGTSDRTYNNSLKLMETLGIRSEEIDISEACRLHFRNIGHNADVHDTTYENSQARERTQVLMDYAGSCGGFVVGTGDLSELALGWCTYNADHMSMYGVNASIPKTLVRWMIDSIVQYKVFPDSTDVLQDILDTPISPELLPPDKDGKIAQETESIIGPYSLHDFFLYYFMRYGFEPEKIYYLAKKAFSADFSDAVILKWMKEFYKRFFSQQFKRSCLPDCVKVGSICLSPRGDWRMPSDASAKLWLERIEHLKDF